MQHINRISPFANWLFETIIALAFLAGCLWAPALLRAIFS